MTTARAAAGRPVPPGPPPVTGAGRLTSPDPAGYCLVEGLESLRRPAWGAAPPPWAPGQRETIAHVKRMGRGGSNAVYDDRLVMLSAIDIFADLGTAEIEEIVKVAPMRVYEPGALLYSPHNRVQALFILRGGKVRIFRLSGDGRALTTAVIHPGTIFGEMVLLGQQMYDNYAEALEEASVCVMNRADVSRLLLADARISARIAEILGKRLAAMERRLSDSVFKSVPQRIAATLCTLADRAAQQRPGSGEPTQLAVTHEQLAALVGTSRETATKALGELADRGVVKLRRGKIVIVDPGRLAEAAGEP